MVRSGGGNASSIRKARLTHMVMSPENIEDIRNWNLDQVDEVTRREIFVADDGSPTLTRIFGVTLMELYELGEGQEYQTYFTGQLGGSLASNDVELVVGLDLQTRDSFVMPVRMPVTIFPDPNLHRQQRQGYYGWGEHGFGVLDNRRVLGGSN